MSTLKRWVDDGAPDGVRELLVAAIEEQPKSGGAERALVALGAGSAVVTGAAHASGVAGATTGAAAAAKGVAASTLAIALKWGFIGAVGAVATLGTVHLALRPPTSEARPSPVTPKPTGLRSSATGAPAEQPATSDMPAVPDVPTVAPTAVEISGAPAMATPPPTPTKGAAAGVGPASSAPPRSDSVRMLEEVSRIDRARSALARGDARGTIAALDSYEANFAERRFEPEALYLRMKALGRLGDGAGERALARRLVTTFPNAPQSARAKVVLSAP